MYKQQYGRVIDAGTVATDDERARFMVLTYLHLAGAIVAFAAISGIFLVTGIASSIAQTLLSSSMGWLLALGAFMGVSYIADRWARSATSKMTQYLGLGIYVVAHAIITAPLLVMAISYAQMSGYNDFDFIWKAGLATLMVTAGLTAYVLVTKQDFSWLRGLLVVGSIAALGFIVLGLIFGFDGGNFFSWAMVFLAGGYILYETSAIQRHYRTDQYVSASLALFASVTLLFWYILRLFMSRD